MAFFLQQAVIHRFEKEKSSLIVPEEKIVKKELFDPSIPTVISLVSGINTLLGKVENNVVWGQFSESSRQGNFPKTVTNLVTDPTASNFKELASIGLDELVSQSSDKAFATGGHTLFAYYISNSIPYLLVAIIKERHGLRLNQDYIPEESVDIDMSKVKQAARINLSRYSEYLQSQALAGEQVEGLDEIDEPALLLGASEDADPDDDASVESEVEDPNERSYLCFVSRGRGSETSEYFVNALGCKKGVASKRATNNAIDVVAGYFRNDPEIKPFANDAQERVIRYLKGKLETKQKASLEGVAAAAKGAVPAEHADLVAHLDGLIEFLNDESRQVPHEFNVNKSVLDRRTKIKAKSLRWELQFEKGALGISSNSEIWYERSTGKLTITKLPADLEEEIISELDSRS